MKKQTCLSAILTILLLLFTTTQAADPDNAAQSPGSGSFVFKLDLSMDRVQTAIWLTDADGKFVDTIFLTQKMAKKGLGNKKNRDIDSPLAGSRMSTVPVWAHWRGVDYGNGNFNPPQDQPLPDGITTATPKAGEFIWRWQPEKPLPEGKYFYYVEVNKSRDKNENHDYHCWYRGQPSVIWKGQITIGERQDSSEAGIVGHGSNDGSHGRIETDISTLTSALKILGKVKASYHP